MPSRKVLVATERVMTYLSRERESSKPKKRREDKDAVVVTLKKGKETKEGKERKERRTKGKEDRNGSTQG